MTEFRNDDPGNLAWVAAHQRDGYVVNTTRSHSPAYLKLHPGSCRHVRVLQSGYAKWTTGDYVKICSTSREALERWAKDVAGGRLQVGVKGSEGEFKLAQPIAIGKCLPFRCESGRTQPTTFTPAKTLAGGVKSS